MDLMDQVKKIIVEQLGVDDAQVSPDAHFIDDLGADSLDTVELILSFEEAFNISIPDEEAEKLETVGKALEYLEKKLEK
jgi:acyl carrier protein